jgi:hypothetical protein
MLMLTLQPEEKADQELVSYGRIDVDIDRLRAEYNGMTMAAQEFEYSLLNGR